jgi:ATP-dependent helicase/nuclease subunit A
MSHLPTEAQDRAIRTMGGDLCVTAGAGCGKTFTLVRRFHHLVAVEEVPVGAILAITFTEKAASQMKERIAEQFEEAGLERQRREIEAASISTIHGLCARLLREHAIEAAVDPRFTVLEEVEADRLKRACLQDLAGVWQQDRSDDLEVLRLLPAFGLEDEILGLLERQRAAGVTPGDRTDGEPPDLDAALAAVLTVRDELIDAADGAKLTAKTQAGLKGLDAALVAFRAAETEDDLWAANRQARAAVKGNVSAIVRPAIKAMRAALEDLRAVLAERRAAPVREIVVDLVRDLAARYASAKDEAGYVDFADLELRARDLLRDRSDVAERLRAQHPFLLVDEFQDVSRIQAELIGRLRSPGKSFSVGDVKQSIYGFRNADIEVILDEADAVGESGRITLPETFRSRRELLAVVETVFARHWPEGERIALEPMVAAGEFLPLAQGPCVELLLADGGKMDAARRREAEVIADRMVSFVEGRSLTLTKGGEERRVAWGDIALLLRATSDIKIYERALLQRDVPFRVLSGRGFWEAREIVDLANLLRVVAGPGEDEVALAATLRSPIVGLSDDALLRLFPPVARGAYREFSWEPSGLGDEEAARLAAFRDSLVRLRAARGRLSLAGMVAAALAETGLADRVLLQRNGRQRIGNLRKIRALARDLDAKGLFSLSDFIALIEERRDLTVREAEAASGDVEEDVVKLMTVHGAKGLEYPVVFLADLTRGKPGDRTLLHWNPEDGLGMKVKDGDDWVETETAVRVKRRRAEAEEAESHRLLYVAMTRAAEHLVLSAGVKGKGTKGAWFGSILEGLGLDLAEIPPGESEAGPEGARVRVVRSLDEEGRRCRILRPLARERFEDLARGEALNLPLEDVGRDEVERFLAAADAPVPEQDHADYVVTVTEVLTWMRSPEEHRARFRMDRRDWSPAEAASEGRGTCGGSDEEGSVPRSDAALGRAAHRFLEVFDPGDADEAAIEMARRFLEEEGLLTGTGEPARRIVNGARRFHAGEIGQAIAGATRVRREAPFVVRLPFGPGGGLLLRGTIDLLLETPDGDWLVDYKTGRTDTAETHAQMRLYALAIEKVLGRRPNRAILWSLPRSRGAEVSLSASDLDRALTELEKFAAAARAPTLAGEK